MLHRCARFPEECLLRWHVGRWPYISSLKGFTNALLPSDLLCPTRRGSKEGERHSGAGNAPFFRTWEKRHLSFTITVTLEDGTSIMPWK